MSEHKRPQQYAYLEQLSLEELEGIIRADAESEEKGDTDFIYAVLEVIDEKERALPGYEPVDVNEAWTEFLEYYNTREGADLSLYPIGGEDGAESGPVPAHSPERPRLHIVRRHIVVVAAAIGVAAALLLTVQAAGVDVFGAIAHWTDEVFSFSWAGRGTPERPEWAEALIEQGVDTGMIPALIPDGYLPEKLTVSDIGLWKEFDYLFISPENNEFRIKIQIYSSPEMVQVSVYEKDASLVESYDFRSEKAYAFSNNDLNTITYLEGLTEISIIGNLSVEELKQILDSIGGFDS